MDKRDMCPPSPVGSSGKQGSRADQAAMRYGSVCSGIEAATVAWHPLGWEPSFFSEIEAFPRAVLQHHFPTVPLHGDFTTIEQGQYEPIDLLVGGTPCQSFSVAGLRGGLADDRGNLALEYLRLADRLRPRWLVWENVPGVLSSNGGRDFGAILGGMVELGYGFAYRVLDARYFGVPQRRRRVFVVGYLGDWRPAAAVLFERHSLQGHSAPSREKGKTAPTIPSRSSAGGGLGTDFDCDGGLIHAPAVARCVTTSTQRIDWETETFVAHAIQAGALRENPKSGPDGVGVQEAIAYTLEARAEVQAVAYRTAGDGAAYEEGSVTAPLTTATDPNANVVAFDLRGREGGAQFEGPHDTANIRAASGGSSRSYVATSAVRRLTPRECERLQGFPDDYTLVPVPKVNRHGNVTRAPLAKDGPRYKALGNSMAVPVMRWIGERIQQVEALVSIPVLEAAE